LGLTTTKLYNPGLVASYDHPARKRTGGPTSTQV